MTAIDTNVLVRYLVQDDPAQAALANDFMAQLTQSKPGYVSVIVLVELYWVLNRAYKFEKSRILDLMRMLVRADDLQVESSLTVSKAIQRALAGVDFADALILEEGMRAGCTRMVTFDRRAAQMSGVTLLQGETLPAAPDDTDSKLR